jgi:hypothetical protein
MIEAIATVVCLLIFASALYVVWRACSRIVDIEPDLELVPGHGWFTAEPEVQSGDAEIIYVMGEWVDPKEL